MGKNVLRGCGLPRSQLLRFYRWLVGLCENKRRLACFLKLKPKHFNPLPLEATGIGRTYQNIQSHKIVLVALIYVFVVLFSDWFGCRACVLGYFGFCWRSRSAGKGINPSAHICVFRLTPKCTTACRMTLVLRAKRVSNSLQHFFVDDNAVKLNEDFFIYYYHCSAGVSYFLEV